jgi:hypothetical protein
LLYSSNKIDDKLTENLRLLPYKIAKEITFNKNINKIKFVSVRHVKDIFESRISYVNKVCVVAHARKYAKNGFEETKAEEKLPYEEKKLMYVF